MNSRTEHSVRRDGALAPSKDGASSAQVSREFDLPRQRGRYGELRCRTSRLGPRRTSEAA